MVDKAGTLTPAENAVLQMLRHGAADLAARTEVYTVRRLSGPGKADDAGRGRLPVEVRTVDAKVARRLAKLGLVDVEHGTARLTPLADDIIADDEGRPADR